ncbi:MarR family transcriptional regulator [Natrialbaceae archaeon GCM10025810]|uniref:MarR family transcriptional regulator n=1 Tax=Halovalidus salilacus TaxID=3075124 RepID=UPI00361ECDD3
MRTDARADAPDGSEDSGASTLERERAPAVAVPADLESPRAKLVYLAVAVWGEISADDLCERLALRKGTVLSIANGLRERGYLERRGMEYALA